MLGQIQLYPHHKGNLFSAGDKTYALLNGQILSRSAYPEFSSVWASGTFGSTGNSLALPDLDESYIRGVDFGAGVDPEANSRVAYSGIAPSGIECGSYQLGSFKSHEHVNGTQEAGSYQNGTSTALFAYNTLVTTNTTSVSTSCEGHTITGTSDQTLWEPAHYKLYPYIRVK